MTEQTTTPTPTNEQQDARMVIDHETARDAIEATIYLTPEAKVEVQTLLRTHAYPLAAVSAAAPDERVCYSDECGEPCQSWQAARRAEIADLRRENATIAQRLGEARAALAARPAPAVNGEADNAGSTVVLKAQADAWDEAVAMCCQMIGVPNVNWPNRHRRALEAITVADAPAAECNCGFGGAHDPANPRCRVNDPTEAWLTVTDEGRA